MTRPVATLALMAFCFCFLVPFSRADVCVTPRIKSAKACGVVTDPYGMPIPRATIKFGPDGSESSVITDQHGTFSVSVQGTEVRMKVDAFGFRTEEVRIGSLKEPGSNCKKPILVMLTLGSEGCGMISLRKSDLLIVKKD